LEALRREAEAFDLLDLEPSPQDRLGGVARGMTAAGDRRE
jgi:hypothetical protein